MVVVVELGVVYDTIYNGGRIVSPPPLSLTHTHRRGAAQQIYLGIVTLVLFCVRPSYIYIHTCESLRLYVG